MKQKLVELKGIVHILSNEKKIVETLFKEPQKFEGLYEPVYHLMNDKKASTNVFKEWHIRANYIFPKSELEYMMKFYSEATIVKKYPAFFAKYFVHCFQKAGITRDEPKDGKLLVSAFQASAYRALDGHIIYEGDTIPIITAAWYCKGIVIEHGLSGEIKKSI